MTRHWYQLHLTTLILLFAAASTIAALNFTQHTFRIDEGWRYEKNWSMLKTAEYGWPWKCATTAIQEKFIYSKYGVHNIVSAVAILAVIAIVCEIIVRRKFRIHLSTAILLTLVAGALIGLNIRGIDTTLVSDYSSLKPITPVLKSHYRFGWPFPAENVVTSTVWTSADPIGDPLGEKGIVPIYLPRYNVLLKKFAALNILIAVIILIAIALISESIIRKTKPLPANGE